MPIKKILFLFFILLPKLAVAFYCGNNLVTEGESLYEVKTKCGHPDDIQQWTEAEAITIKTLVSRKPLKYVSTEQIQEHHFEDWIYNFGPHKFIHQLRFKNGQLIKISNKGYGD